LTCQRLATLPSSNLRVPGLVPGILLCGHSGVSLMSPGGTAGINDFAKFTVGAEALAVRAIADKRKKSFVLSRINEHGVRAFEDKCTLGIRAFEDR
jgi:hypothetical protein